jgi:uncharacterized protein DUF5655
MATKLETPNALQLGGPTSEKLYQQLLAAIKNIGSYKVEVKKTSIHLVRKSAFAGVRLRKEYLLLTIKAPEAIRNKRIFKAEQASAHRWHLEVKVATASEIDKELMGWLQESYEMSE